MKKKMTGIVLCKESGNSFLKKIKVKGWKVNPYFFIHKTLNSNLEPRKPTVWTVTHIPTGYALTQRIELKNSLTKEQLKKSVDKWFPAWISKTIGKKVSKSEEIITRNRALLLEIKDYQNKISPKWRM